MKESVPEVSAAMAPTEATESPLTRPKSSASINAVGLSLLLATIVLMFGSAGLIATWLLTRVPPTPDCKELSPLATDAEQLYCMEQTALSGTMEDLEVAIAFVEQWSPQHTLYAESQRLMTNWSKSILDLARRKMRDGNLEEAIAIANKVPETSPVYDRAQTTIQWWEDDWDTGQEIYDKALKALENEQFGIAYQQASRLNKLDDPYWSQEQFVVISQKIAAEKQYRKQLEDARNWAEYGTVEDYVEAIEKANKIPTDSLIRTAANKEIAAWSREILEKAEERLDEDDLQGAIDVAKRIPSYSPRYAEAQDFIGLGAAIDIAKEDTLGSFLLAQVEASQIKPGRPLYSEAQAKMAQWQEGVQDEIQIQWASAIASLGQPAALKEAQAFAQMIAVDRPRRIQAQTKVAHWRKEVERLKARPILAMARNVSTGGTIADFQKARELAGKIEQGHPLRIEAQTLIAEWNKRIEILEDEPTLKRARTLAKAGELWEAIDIAEQIDGDRALYSEAQADIDEWSYQIQLTQDEADMRDAEYLASLGRYNEAIGSASRIGWGRPLYYEAQDSMARWQAKLDALYAPPPPVYQEPVYQEPVYQEPVYQEPVYQEPVYQEPVYYEEPVYQEPVYQEPVYQAPAPEPAYEAAPEPSDYSPEPEFP
ncbi:hypothetical protein [Roseofilum casamattae]|uniref:Chromosome segregation ATPase n=1 Tax=Roseofilum casamattae BLCC-M143 TaxID=3022442 RepID=A0ABT7BX40_9CYAN|nr:hypothetical protein [Roseofilum casamattae]MDJ1183021.1 hypothetical protein [Roseofilum casamattae BLCC-M143]